MFQEGGATCAMVLCEGDHGKLEGMSDAYYNKYGENLLQDEVACKLF